VAATREERKSSRRKLLGGVAATSALVAGGLKLPMPKPVSAQRFEATTSRVFTFGAAITFADLAPSSFYNNAVINVAGLRGTVVGVRVRLLGLRHQNVADLNVLLLAPNGNAVMLMSDVGEGADVDNLNLTFSETAATLLPATGPIFSGDYAATNRVGSDEMPPNAPIPPNRTSVAQLTGVPWTEAVGPWTLFTYDKRVTAGGFLRNWTLELLTTNRAPVARRDLYSVKQGELLRVSRRKGVLANDTDLDNDRLAVVPLRIRHRLGRLILRSNGSFTFQARPNRTGVARFTYTMSDGEVVRRGRLVIRVTA
jgi:subtilisin-like proprotein convertase family protein